MAQIGHAAQSPITPGARHVGSHTGDKRLKREASARAFQPLPPVYPNAAKASPHRQTIQYLYNLFATVQQCAYYLCKAAMQIPAFVILFRGAP